MDSYEFKRCTKPDGTPDWDLASIAASTAALLFANDTAYIPDSKENVLKFGTPREIELSFRLPAWLRTANYIFRMDADGAHEVQWAFHGERVTIKAVRTLDAIYVVTNDESIRTGTLQRRRAALDQETATAIDIDSLRAIQK